MALYAAVLSTINLILGLKARKPEIIVKMKEGHILDSAGQKSEQMVFLSALNRAHRTIKLMYPAILLPDKTYLLIPNPLSKWTFPCELPSEDKCDTWTSVSYLAGELRKHGLTGKVELVGVFFDLVDRAYKSKPLVFDIDEQKDAQKQT